MSYQTEITKLLNKLADAGEKKNPDADAKNSPHGGLIGAAYFWDKVKKFAEGKDKATWKALEDAGYSNVDVETLDAGEYVLTDTPTYSVQVVVSQPRKTFDGQWFAEQLYKSKYKVPLHVTAALMNDAKLPGKGSKTYKIIEK